MLLFGDFGIPSMTGKGHRKINNNFHSYSKKEELIVPGKYMILF